MTMAYTSDDRKVPNRSMFYRAEGVSKKTITVAVHVADLILNANTRALYIPEGFLEPGRLMGRYTSGANSGLWAPMLPGFTGTANPNDALGVLWDPVYLTRDGDGAIQETRAAVAVIPEGAELFMLRSKIPKLGTGDSFANQGVATGATTPHGRPTPRWCDRCRSIRRQQHQRTLIERTSRWVTSGKTSHRRN